MILPRRQFLTGLASLIAAPAVVRASSLMPVKALTWRDGWFPLGPRIVRVPFDESRITCVTFVDLRWFWVEVDSSQVLRWSEQHDPNNFNPVVPT